MYNFSIFTSISVVIIYIFYNDGQFSHNVLFFFFTNYVQKSSGNYNVVELILKMFM